MENTDLINKKDRILICGLAYILLIAQSFSVIDAVEPQFPNDFKVSEYFSFFGSGGIDWQALNDPNNNPILVACIKAVADESLKPLGILDVEQRLERLERGNLIEKVDGRYILAFPAIIGVKRERLREYAEQAAQQLVPSTEGMIAQIRIHLAGHDVMLYHVLWSVVMDGGPAWDAARAEMNKKIDAGDTSIENKAWLLYPSHPFRAGTNSWNNSSGHLRVTWSRNTPSPNVIGRVMSQCAIQLIQAIEQDRAIESADAKVALDKYGLIDEMGKVRLYTIQADSEASQSYVELGSQFGRQIMTQLDVKRVADMLDVSPGVAFVIAYHEICWQLLQDLSDKKVLSVPQIVAQAGTKTSDAYQLVSLTTIQSVKDPLLDTEMTTEEAQAIEEYRRIKARILAGESYEDKSTPLHAVLTRFSTWKPQERDYFMGLDILRAQAPSAKPEEGSLWPVFAGDTELADTFILAYSKGQWIWIGNMGSNFDWNSARPTFEKWARDKIGQEVTANDSVNPSVGEAQAPGDSTGNQVLSLDGQGDCMRVADSQSLRSFSDAITIEVWLKASSFSAESGNVNSIIRKNIIPGAENFLLRFRNVNGTLLLDMGLGSEIGGLQVADEFGVGTWYHLAGTYDGSTITIFVNGLVIDSKNISGQLQIDQSDLYIGRGDPTFSAGEYFHGLLDEIRLWNVTRSQEQIQAAINTPLTGNQEGLIGYWNFDDRTAKDLSDHGNDGILNGDARIVESPRPDSTAPEQEQPSKLLAWWKLDEVDGNDVTDSSGNDCMGTLVGNPQWRSAGGKVGGALEFDGDGDCVQIENEAAFDIPGPITVAAWFKVNTFDKRWQALITKGDMSWRLQRYAEDDTLAFHCTGITSVTSQRPEGIEGKKNVNDEQWHHVVGVYDGSAILLYIDGVLDNSSKASGEINMNDSAVIIGGNSEQSSREWNGLIDEVSIIGGVIDANAVHALYTGADPIIIAQTANTQLQSSDKLVAWWKFDNDANDSAGASHGTTHGNPAYADGKVGRAISFDGDDYVDCGNPDSLNFGTGDWAISAWIKTTQSGEEDTNKGTVFANGADGGGGIRYTLAVNEGQTGSITLTTDNDEYKVQAISNTVVNDDAWHHIVGMRNAGQLHLYVDGVLDGGNYLPGEYDLSAASRQNVYIGAITSNDDNSLYKYFVGLIDEVCIFAGAIDAKGVLALYSGEDPVTIAKTALIRPKVQPRPTSRDGAIGDIEGNWRIVSDQVSQQAIIEIRKKTDGTLAATIVAESPDETTPAIPLDEVTFENGMLRFKMISNQGDFEGTMKADGSTIEGQFQQQDKTMTLALKRVVAAPNEAVQVAQEQLQDLTGGKSNVAIALILVLALAGVVAGIVFFLVKSSIR